MAHLFVAGTSAQPRCHTYIHVANPHNIRTDMDALPFCKVTLRRLRCPWGPYSTEKKGYPATPRTLGEEIRKRRLYLNLRQVDVAELIGCDEMTVVNWEKGYASPRIYHMPKVVEFLGFNPLPKSDKLSQRLVNHRNVLGMTQKEFARQLGIDPSTLARWERHERVPTGHLLLRIELLLSGNQTRAFESKPFAAQPGNSFPKCPIGRIP
jgi:transcriptional regulator with XRE-family HTH domain